MEKQIQIDLYEGAYGRTIRINTRNKQALFFIKRLFERLSVENNLEIEMADFDIVKLTGGLQSLRLKQSSKDRTLGGHLLMQGQFQFIWTRSKEGWKDCAGLVEGIRTGHQYLTTEEYDDALVVVSML